MLYNLYTNNLSVPHVTAANLPVAYIMHEWKPVSQTNENMIMLCDILLLDSTTAAHDIARPWDYLNTKVCKVQSKV